MIKRALPPGVRERDGWLGITLAVCVLVALGCALWSPSWPSAFLVTALIGWLLAHMREVYARAQLAMVRFAGQEAIVAAFELGVERAGGDPKGKAPTIH